MIACELCVPGIQLPMADKSLTVQDSPTGDRDLLHRISQGETERFADLINRYSRHVIRTVARRVPVDQVEEIVHDVFVTEYFGLRQFTVSVSLDRRLAGIAVRTCYDY